MMKSATSPNVDCLDEEIKRLYERKLLIEDVIASLEQYEESLSAVRQVRRGPGSLAFANAGQLAS